jgi:hypothetical protein
MKQVIVPATVWSEVVRQLAEIKNAVTANDLLNRKQACEVLGVTSKTLSNYLASGRVVPDSINELGHQFFSRRRLLGIK